MIVFPFVCSCMGPHYIVHKWYNVTLYSYILEGQLHEEIQCPLHLPFYVLVIWGTKLLCRFCSDFIACKIFIHCQYKWTSTYKCENLSKFPSQVELKQILDSYIFAQLQQVFECKKVFRYVYSEWPVLEFLHIL